VSSNVTAFSPPRSWGHHPLTRRKTLFIKILEPSNWAADATPHQLLRGEISDGSWMPFCLALQLQNQLVFQVSHEDADENKVYP
jgi:hypothetical protein